MSSEILAVLEYMEKEKGISREDMIATIEGAVKAAAERGVNSSSDVRVEINAKNGAMQAWTQLKSLSLFLIQPGKFMWIKQDFTLKTLKLETWWNVKWILLT